VVASTALLIASAVVAVLFLCSQAMILKEAKGIPAWRISGSCRWSSRLALRKERLFLAASAQFSALKPLVGSSRYCDRFWLRCAAGSGDLSCELEAGRADARLRYSMTQAVVLYRPRLPLALIAAGLAMAAAGLCSPLRAASRPPARLKFILVTRAGFNQGSR
jgi:hypothetical protein